MGAGCGQFCKYRCHDKVTKEEREDIFKQFWGLKDHTRQWDFINRHTRCCAPPKHKNPEGKRKETSRTYFFIVNGNQERMCRTMFLKTLGVTETWVKTAMKKLGDGHTISPDKRGKHSKVNIDAKVRMEELIETHIKLFPKVPSHFCRARSKRQYLENGLSLRKMYKLCVNWMQTEHHEDKIVSERRYRDVFCTKFNLGFHMPKKDQCELCTLYQNCSPGQKKKLQEKYDAHIVNKETARKFQSCDKEAAKQDPKICFACFDLQKVLTVPKCEVGPLYYKRKLSIFNFTIYDAKNSKGYCYVWTEADAKRGADEVASCVLHFIKFSVEKDGVDDFRFWSDNCAGQNKNKYLFSMYTYASAHYKVKISHRYLEKGHTQNEGDSMHGTIERAAKGKQMFIPEQWMKVMKEAKQVGESYTVFKMRGNILDFHTLAEKHQNWLNHPVHWRQVREVNAHPSPPGRLLVKEDLDKPPQAINVTKAVRGRPIVLAMYPLKPAYTGPIGLAKLDLEDLASMCKDLIIPSQYHPFYKSLQGFPSFEPVLAPVEEESEDEGRGLCWDDIKQQRNWLWGEESADEETDYEGIIASDSSSE